MNKTFSISILGICGHSGGYVLNGLSMVPEARVTAITGCNGDASELLGKCREMGQEPEVAADFAALLKHPADLVVIDGPWIDHARHCIMAMEAGFHVLVEKPPATHLSELAELRKVQARTGRHLLTIYGMRYDKPFVTAYLDDEEMELQAAPSLLPDVVAICREGKTGLLSTRQTLEVSESALRAREAADLRHPVPITGLQNVSSGQPCVSTRQPPTVLLVGLEGMGRSHAQTALRLEQQGLCRITGGVDPAHPQLADDHPLKGHSLRLYPDLSRALEDTTPELVVLCTPIHTHAALAATALPTGCSVLLEKPLCGSLEEARALVSLGESSPGFLAMGFQMCFDPGAQKLKEDIQRGRFGAPRDFSVSTLWPRPVSYYQRNSWAGRIRTDDGQAVLDSPHNNACAHFLFQMLWLLGENEADAAQVESVRAALGRAHVIENCDTALLEMRTCNGVDLRFAASHTVTDLVNPRFRLEFENATVLAGSGGSLCAHTPEEIIAYPDGADSRLQTCLAALSGQASIPCDARAASRHTEVVVAAQKTDIIEAPEELVERLDDGHVVVRGLTESIASVCDLKRLPDIPWLPLGQPITI